MSDYIEVVVLAEGLTELTFIRDVLAPVMQPKNIYMHEVLIGGIGGDVRFARAKKAIGIYLKHRNVKYITTMLDYYGIDSGWPGKSEVIQAISTGRKITAHEKGVMVEDATLEIIKTCFSEYRPEIRFIPYIQMHEFEALLFSDASILAGQIRVRLSDVEVILRACGEPEEVNDGPETAPSKRLLSLCDYRKVKMGKTISEAIGIQAIREKCPHFNDWLNKLESL